MITCTKGNQGLGKWESAALMVRLVKELQDKLEEAGLLENGDETKIANAVYDFQATLPKKVKEDLLHG